MTTILTYQGNGYAAVASDTRATGGTTLIGVRKIEKIGDYLLGNSGDFRSGNILHNAFKPPACKPALTGKKLDDFFTATFIPALRGCFDMYGYSTPSTNDVATHLAHQDSHIVVIVNATVYIVYENYEWCKSKGRVDCIGSGRDYAIGAMEILLKGERSPSARKVLTAMRQAMKVAARYDSCTGAPFHFRIQRTPRTTK